MIGLSYEIRDKNVHGKDEFRVCTRWGGGLNLQALSYLNGVLKLPTKRPEICSYGSNLTKFFKLK